MENDLKRICAYCGKDMGTKPSPETGETHGMCPECLAAHIKKREAEKKMGNDSTLPSEVTMTLQERAAEGRNLYGSDR